MTVHRYLVTGGDGPRLQARIGTGLFANWINGRHHSDGRETWLVTCMDVNAPDFLTCAQAAGVTVEEIDGAGDGESYRLVLGEPGSGWAEDGEMTR